MFYTILFLQKNIPVVFCSEKQNPGTAHYCKYDHIKGNA